MSVSIELSPVVHLSLTIGSMEGLREGVSQEVTVFGFTV